MLQGYHWRNLCCADYMLLMFFKGKCRHARQMLN